MSSTLKLEDVIKDPSAFEYGDGLYMAPGAAFDADAPVLVHDVDDVADGEEDPKAALDLGYEYVLIMQDVQSVVENAKMQKPDATVSELLDALRYYYDNDAFIDWSK